MRILVVEDEAEIARILQLELEHEGYSATVARDGLSGLALAQSAEWDLVLLDILLPGMSGIEVCRRLRAESTVPIIMLTAKDDLSDKVSGLDAGADDYITKPFAFEEVLARVRAHLRRTALDRPDAPVAHGRELMLADLVLDPGAHTVRRGGRAIELTRREFDLLEFLLRNQGQVVTRELLLSEVWGYDYAGETNVVDVYIRYLRNKIDTDVDVEARLIHTVRGVGYVLRESRP
jgi:two-component system response regulator ArlR